MGNVFKKGMILGGILAAVATVGFAMSKPGQELSEDLQKDIKTLAKDIKKRLHKLQDVTKEAYDETVVAVVKEYAAQKQMASDAQQHLTAALEAMWNETEAQYKAGE
ncbi:MAG: hypothetical protein WCO25_00190 [Candidatus Uhrbacteria bacterium]